MPNFKNILTVLSLLLVCYLPSTYAQDGANPFEIKDRLEEGDIDRQAPVNATNPFDISRPATTVKKSNPLDVVTPVGPAKAKRKVAKPVKKSSGFVFWLITITLILMTILVTLYKSIVEKSYRSFINENFLKMIHRDQGWIVSFPYMVFYILFFINLATFLFLLAGHYGWAIASTPFRSFAICMGGVILAFVLKHLLLILLGGIFPLSKEIRQYSFTIVIFSIILGLALVPFNLLIAFTDPDLARVLIYATLAVIAGAYAYRSIRALIIASSHISLHTFHFFMYLCTAEIAPVILVTKLVLSQGQM